MRLVHRWKQLSTKRLHSHCCSSSTRRIATQSTIHRQNSEAFIRRYGLGVFRPSWKGCSDVSRQGRQIEQYIGILEEKLHLFMHTLQCSIVQQDNAPCHASRATKKWFAENNVEVLDWPGNSPDLNPIENLWQTVKLKMKRDRCTSISALKNELRRVWCLETTPETYATLVKSMPRRIRAVMQNKGFPTKY